MQENMFVAGNTDFQHLSKLGFTETETLRLIAMKAQAEEQSEVRERAEEQRRLDFIRWLVATNRLTK